MTQMAGLSLDPAQFTAENELNMSPVKTSGAAPPRYGPSLSLPTSFIVWGQRLWSRSCTSVAKFHWFWETPYIQPLEDLGRGCRSREFAVGTSTPTQCTAEACTFEHRSPQIGHNLLKFHRYRGGYEGPCTRMTCTIRCTHKRVFNQLQTSDCSLNNPRTQLLSASFRHQAGCARPRQAATRSRGSRRPTATPRRSRCAHSPSAAHGGGECLLA